MKTVEPVTKMLSARCTFFELMRRVEALQRRQDGQTTRSRRMPKWLRIEQPAAMHFASTEVECVHVEPAAFADAGDGPQVTVIQRHFGLFAPYGPLPLHVTEHAMQEKRFERNAAFERFVNLACGELAWLHYVAWSSMHPVFGHERERNPFVERVTALADAHRKPAAGRDPFEHHALACRRAFPGLYCAPRRSLAQLQRMLGVYFGVPLRVVPRYGRWIPVAAAASRARRLGGWRLGARIWDVQHSAEIVIGPLEADEFHRWQRRAATVLAMSAVVADFGDGRIDPVIKVQVWTRPELAGRIGRMRVGVDAWSRPGRALRTLTVYESFRD